MRQYNKQATLPETRLFVRRAKKIDAETQKRKGGNKNAKMSLKTSAACATIRCQGVTAKGKQCKNNAKYGSFCHAHAETNAEDSGDERSDGGKSMMSYGGKSMMSYGRKSFDDDVGLATGGDNPQARGQKKTMVDLRGDEMSDSGNSSVYKMALLPPFSVAAGGSYHSQRSHGAKGDAGGSYHSQRSHGAKGDDKEDPIVVETAIEWIKGLGKTKWYVGVVIEVLSCDKATFADAVIIGTLFIEKACEALGLGDGKAIAAACSRLVGKRQVVMGSDIAKFDMPKVLREELRKVLGQRKVLANSITPGVFKNMLIKEAVEIAGGWQAARTAIAGKDDKTPQAKIVTSLRNAGILYTREFQQGKIAEAANAVVMGMKQAMMMNS